MPMIAPDYMQCSGPSPPIYFELMLEAFPVISSMDIDGVAN